MDKLLQHGVDEYIEQHLPERPEVFHDMEQTAKERKFPIVGPQVGQFLKMLAQTLNATRVFELGSGFGYSALWFATGMPNEGQITLTDYKDEYLKEAEHNLSRLWQNGKATFLPGDALEHFRAARNESWDIVFSDIDKEAYPEVIELAFEKLRIGGYFITDNALWDGKVLNGNPDKATKGVIEFNKRLAAHEGFENTIIPIRDGLAVARKLADDDHLWLPRHG